MAESKCDKCKTGEKQVSNYRKKKSGEITEKEFINEATKLGSICFDCIYNGIGKRKAWAMKKLKPSFQSIDLFEVIE